jgi:predicted transcriptional regulator
MKRQMDDILWFWVEVDYEHLKNRAPNRSKAELIVEILREFEACGDAVRHLDSEGHVAWKASASMIENLADAEREVKEDMEDRP